MEQNEPIWKDRKRTVFGLPWTFTKYSLTPDRLFIERGLAQSTEDEVRLYRILDIRLVRSLSQKMFGLGTLQINSSDRTLKNFELKNIKNSKYVKELLSEMVEKQRMEKRVVNREVMGGPGDFNDDGFDDDDDGNN
ncbi:MAG: PH domain-containing protein [Lachnospiraceae bacterium]|nr:PH domain-containing protein [Lachnospiraceae bacterium]